MSASLELPSREEKDAELDKRIEALRRKNQALLRRYQEIEEDRRQAEQEGVAVTGARRPRAGEALPGQSERRRAEPEAAGLEERRAPGRKAAAPGARGEPQPGGRPPRAEALWAGPGGAAGGRGRRARGRAGLAGSDRLEARPGEGVRAGLAGGDRRSQEWEERRRRNIEQMNEEMEKIAEFERGQRDGLQEKNPVRNFLDDPRRSAAFGEAGQREGSRRHVRNWGGVDFEKVKTGLQPGQALPSPGRGVGRQRRPTPVVDMTLSMTGRERAEYTRWKQEREQIDQERLARHRQPTGEWRREWDAQKTDSVLKEGSGPQGSSADQREHSTPPPKLPTFGEFVVGQPGDRQRRTRGRGRPRGSSAKPYSMHDDRWESGKADRTLPVLAREKVEATLVLQVEPQVVTATEGDEEEDEWEDVSGEEEEEEAEASSSQDSSSEKNGPRPSGSPLPPRQPRQQPPTLPVSLQAAATPGTAMGMVEEYQPVFDWGEEMEMHSPRTSCGEGPLVALAAQGPLSGDPPAGTAASPAPRAPEAEIKIDAEVPEPKAR